MSCSSLQSIYGLSDAIQAWSTTGPDVHPRVHPRVLMSRGVCTHDVYPWAKAKKLSILLESPAGMLAAVSRIIFSWSLFSKLILETRPGGEWARCQIASRVPGVVCWLPCLTMTR